uniref:Fibrinogen C-terminal domain-containing protein n=1 Tax=Ciona savignyi TaxID=51511 RepID=H2Z6A5_CIOSA
QCAYTFVVPQAVRPNGRICVNGNTENEDGGITMLQMYKRGMDAPSVALQSVATVQRMQTDVSATQYHRVVYFNLEPLIQVTMLKQETRNSQDRISQLYMQLMHEIINKRDNTIEMQQLKNTMLNGTVLHYELQEKHNKLNAEHTALKGLVQQQSEQIERLRLIATQSHTISDPMLVVEHMAYPAEASSGTTQSHIRDTNVHPTTPTMSVPRRPPPGQLQTNVGRFRDCTAVQRAGHTRSGLYNLRLPGVAKRMKVWCDMDQDPGGWIVIQRRSEGRVNFYRNMASYKRGFGKLKGDFWLGLENIHKLTSQPSVNYKLHIDMEDWGGKKRFVEYRSFRVDAEDTGYLLRIAHYSGNAGDSLTWHNNMRFTTFDVDNDPFPRNCGDFQRGGWWYNMCAHSNLNGIFYKDGHYRSQYQDGIYWTEWRGGSYSLKKVSMKIRPTE